MWLSLILMCGTGEFTKSGRECGFRNGEDADVYGTLMNGHLIRGHWGTLNGQRLEVKAAEEDLFLHTAEV